MNLSELLTQYSQRPDQSVPDWMLGYFKRYSISFADGKTDVLTNVCWLQSRNFTLDLRLPIRAQQVKSKPWEDYSVEELLVMADYEGWEALSEWDGELLKWCETDNSLQLHNRWIEPGILKRFGNCMIELSPSGAYVEDWRLQPSRPGPLIGLRLIEERNVETNEVCHKGGGLIICGDYAGLVLGRPQEINARQQYNALRELVIEAQGNSKKLEEYFKFETSVAKGSITEGYKIILSTKPERMRQLLFSLDGFELIPNESGKDLLGKQHLIKQKFYSQGELHERIFVIDTLEQEIHFEQSTDFTEQSQEWFEREEKTLTRYSHPLF
jgi:hypothetical protein